MRDIENDRKSGKNTIVVMLGAKNSKIYHYCLLICSAVSLAIFLSSPKFNSLFFLTFIPFVFVAIHIKKVMETNNPQEYEPELKKIALSTFFVSLIFAILGAQFA